MKITIEFDEKYDALQALHAHDMHYAMSEALGFIRSKTKYETPSEETMECLDRIRTLLLSGLEWDDNR